MKLFRQGDLLIKEIKRLPKKVNKINGNVLATGEATGHSHKLIGDNVQLFENKNNKYFQTAETVTLQHEEHKPIEISKGTFMVIGQREYTPTGALRVTD